jgi:phenylpropionate dioxygenase-like ring-hydroxylating dioxygenase large terminal subunit
MLKLAFNKNIIRFPSSFINRNKPKPNPILSLEKQEEHKIKNKYPLQWFVVEESKNIRPNQLYKTMIREKEYVFWKDNNNQFTALDNYCNHRGADLSKGAINKNYVVCPYHGAEFDRQGQLCKLPGISLNNETNISKCFHQDHYPITEINGWVYLNTVSKHFLNISVSNHPMIYIEPESKDKAFHCLFLKSEINAPSRIVCENLLDVIHISYVHTFGNKKNPLPLNDPIVFMKKGFPNHYAIHYFYKSGERSFIRRFLQIPDLQIENEFILPHTIISRVKFGESTKTIITFSLPKNKKQTILFMKVYRNFIFSKSSFLFSSIYNYIMNIIVNHIVRETILEDVTILENINIEKVNGKYNLKYDKFPNMYRKLYNRIYESNF